MCQHDCVIYACGHPRFRVTQDPQKQCSIFPGYGGRINQLNPVCALTPYPTFANVVCDSVKFVGGESNNVETDWVCGQFECFDQWYADQQKAFKNMEEMYQKKASTYHTAKTPLRQQSEISLDNQELLDATFGEEFRTDTHGAPIWQAFSRFHALRREARAAVRHGGSSNPDATRLLRAAQVELNKIIPPEIVALDAAISELLEAGTRDHYSAHPSAETEAQCQRRWDTARFWCGQQPHIQRSMEEGKTLEACTRTFFYQDPEQTSHSEETFVGVDAWWLMQRPARQS